MRLEDIPDFRDGQRLMNETAHAARFLIERNKNTNTFEYQGLVPQFGADFPTGGVPPSSSPAPCSTTGGAFSASGTGRDGPASAAWPAA